MEHLFYGNFSVFTAMGQQVGVLHNSSPVWHQQIDAPDRNINHAQETEDQ